MKENKNNELIIDLSDCNTEEEMLAKIPPEILDAIANGTCYPIEVDGFEKDISSQLSINYNYNPIILEKE